MQPETASTTDSAINKVNPNEFDPLQEKQKQEEAKKEQAAAVQHSNNERPGSRPPSLTPTPVPSGQTANTAKPNHQMGEFYVGAPTTYGYSEMPYMNASYPRQHFNYVTPG